MILEDGMEIRGEGFRAIETPSLMGMYAFQATPVRMKWGMGSSFLPDSEKEGL
jgi:hypothetical protein